MPRFAANISTMFTEAPFAERIQGAAAAGFEAIEVNSPTSRSRRATAAPGRRPGRADPAQHAARRFRRRRARTGRPARTGGRVQVRPRARARLRAGARLPADPRHGGDQPAGAAKEACLEVYKANLKSAAEACGRAGRTALIEPINTRDIPGYLLNTPAEGAALLAELGVSNLMLQFDFYHAQIMTGDLARASSATCRSSAMCRSPACPSVTSPTSARSTILTCST